MEMYVYLTVCIIQDLSTESKQGQEEGGELDSNKEVKTHLQVQVRSRGKRWCWTPKLAQMRSRAGRWSWAQKAGLLLLPLFLSSSATDIVFKTVPHSS